MDWRGAVLVWVWRTIWQQLGSNTCHKSGIMRGAGEGEYISPYERRGGGIATLCGRAQGTGHTAKAHQRLGGGEW
eukprot:scaffold10191_cov108-Isochrysis_galbana.AAC.15